uniref:Uncharacterized protein n=1 Tax=Candidatus Kentrum sp. FW TaxID=2126338 RepID=A0A450TSX2_9GAMM|nr:MAG: hypothetical protein BECKFW1821C_GA0114237_102822 [Candidatus Kentron sp. FW]
MEKICVFLGSHMGARPDYVSSVRRLADELVARNLGLVYGGAKIGLMVNDDPGRLLDDFENYGAPDFTVWMHEEES